MLALARLQDKGFLSGAEYGRLASAYQFLRQLEHRLQVVDDRQTHTLPAQPDALELLARRMPRRARLGCLAAAADSGSLRASPRDLRSRGPLEQRFRAGRGFGRRASGRQHRSFARTAGSPPGGSARREPSCSAASSPLNIFWNEFRRIPLALNRLDADPRLAANTLDLFEHSPYFAEELIRTPELLDEVARAGGHQRSGRPAGHRRRIAPLVPPRNGADSGRQRVSVRTHLRYSSSDFGAGRRRDRARLRHCRRGDARLAPAAGLGPSTGRIKCG